MKNSVWRVIYNIVVVCAWVTLAIVVGKWWIALFGALFLSYNSVVTQRYYYRICDKCGRHSGYSPKSPSDAIKVSKRQGWTHIEDGDRDYCPECWEEMK